MNTAELKSKLLSGGFDHRFVTLYGKEAVEWQRARYAEAVDAFASLYGAEREVSLYSVAGRSELSGNHTDHNHGCVIAASINLDIIAVASPRTDLTVRIKSEGHAEDVVDLERYTAPVPAMFGQSGALVAGVAKRFSENGYAVGGFDAYTTSNVLKGSGLSSSAAFEDMVGNLLSHLYNGGRVDNVEIAKISQYAENVYFGKPCGLMDQVACAVGGIVAIDFADPEKPIIEKIPFDLSGAGYQLCITDTGGNHADLTADYAAVPAEMKAVAGFFGKSVLREAEESEVLAKISELRAAVGDRAVLRALHFYEENRRVAKQKEALLQGKINDFFAQVLASGRSSFCYLQNVYTNQNVSEQGLSLALCLTEKFLAGKGCAWRVHGGGFAGTVQAYVPFELVEDYRKLMDGAFGEGHCMALRVRSEGAVKI